MDGVERIKELLDYDQDTGSFLWSSAHKLRAGKKAGCKRKDGYIVIRLDGELLYAHRLAWVIIYGAWPSEFIDHINGDKSDNRAENLRDVDNSVNAQNVKGCRKNNKLSRFLGVQKNHNGWQALITTNGIRVCLGTFKAPEDAHAAYLSAKRELHIGCTI